MNPHSSLRPLTIKFDIHCTIFFFALFFYLSAFNFTINCFVELWCYWFLILILNFIVALVLSNFWLEFSENDLWKIQPISIGIALLRRNPPINNISSQCKCNNPSKLHLFTHSRWTKILFYLDQSPNDIHSIKSWNQIYNHLFAKITSITTKSFLIKIALILVDRYLMMYNRK